MSTTPENPKPDWIKGTKLALTPKPLDFKPEACFPEDWHFHNFAGKPRCQAWAPVSGRQCGSTPVRGRHYCRKHGGKTPVGLAAPSYKTGRYSKYLPEPLLAAYKASLNDPELLDISDDVALLQTRLFDLLGKGGKGEGGHLWIEAKSAYNKLKQSIQDRDASKTILFMTELGEKLNKGASNHENWKEILHTIEQRERAVERQDKRLVDMNQTMTVDRALALIYQIGQIIRAHVQDRATLLLISNDIAYLIGQPGEQQEYPEENQN
jgi:hypothetical protein